MSETPDDVRKAQETHLQFLTYRPLLLRALRYFLENEGEAELVTIGAFEQAERQWSALEGEANIRQVIANAADDQCALLLPRVEGEPERRAPQAAEIFRHLAWYDWERRIEGIELQLSVLRASLREAGTPEADSDMLVELQARFDELVKNLFRSRLGMSADDDEPAGGGVACEVPVPPPHRGPGGGRTFEEALMPARNP